MIYLLHILYFTFYFALSLSLVRRLLTLLAFYNERMPHRSERHKRRGNVGFRGSRNSSREGEREREQWWYNETKTDVYDSGQTHSCSRDVYVHVYALIKLINAFSGCKITWNGDDIFDIWRARSVELISLIKESVVIEWVSCFWWFSSHLSSSSAL